MDTIDRVLQLKNKVKELEEKRAKATGLLEAVELDMKNAYGTTDVAALTKKLNEMKADKDQFEEEFLELLESAEDKLNTIN